MIRELYYERTPIFHSTGEQRRDYIYIDDLLDLAIKVQKTKGFDAINVSSNSSHSVNQMYKIAQEIIGKEISPIYADDAHYWEKYPELFEGFYPIEDSILAHEINKYTLCDNKYAFEKYSWLPKISLHEGLKKLISEEFKLLDRFEADKIEK
jgi:UDP-glucose 4-epimerase